MNIDPEQIMIDQEDRARREILATIAWRALRDIDNPKVMVGNWEMTPELSSKKLSRFLTKTAHAHGTIALYEHEFVHHFARHCTHPESGRRMLQFLMNCSTTNSVESRTLENYGFIEEPEREAMTRSHIWLTSFAAYANCCCLNESTLEEIEVSGTIFAESLRDIFGKIKALPDDWNLPREPITFIVEFVCKPDYYLGAYDQLWNAFEAEGLITYDPTRPL